MRNCIKGPQHQESREPLVQTIQQHKLEMNTELPQMLQSELSAAQVALQCVQAVHCFPHSLSRPLGLGLPDICFSCGRQPNSQGHQARKMTSLKALGSVGEPAQVQRNAPEEMNSKDTRGGGVSKGRINLLHSLHVHSVQVSRVCTSVCVLRDGQR